MGTPILPYPRRVRLPPERLFLDPFHAAPGSTERAYEAPCAPGEPSGDEGEAPFGKCNGRRSGTQDSPQATGRGPPGARQTSEGGPMSAYRYQ
jgi:hypothetical protein